MPKVRPIYVKEKDLKAWREANTPDSCPILGHEFFSPVVDHDHKTGKIRGVISSEGNALIGKIENFFRSRCVNADNDLINTLLGIVEYLRGDQDVMPFHPIGVRQLTKRFNGYRKDRQYLILERLGLSSQEVDACKNSKQRTALYRKALIGEL